jgi:hypothetical protein
VCPIVAAAGSATSSSQIDGVTITKADLTQLFEAMHHALANGDTAIPLVVHVKPAAEMPKYDPEAHYVGTDTTQTPPVITVWVNGSDLKSDTMQDAMAESMLLGIMDAGYAGPNFKKLYDSYAAKDTAAGASAPDPFANRRKFAEALVHELHDNSGSGT